jgi:AcrR family transcriptional regulator
VSKVPPKVDPKEAAILETAFGVFLRYGFRKTSMEEVARAAEISRQGLYLHFATKEELFVATVRHGLGINLAAAEKELADKKRPIDARLIAAFDAWYGPFVAVMGPGSDLADVSKSLVGELVVGLEQDFQDKVTEAIKRSPLKAAYQKAKLGPAELSATLHATARGLKHSATTRAELMAAMSIAVRAMCAVLEDGGSR